ncbi:MAG: RNase adapter RapZ [Kiritimatiellia bacterium]|nr:RNase adapter RapZ [Kiritimatiellia bacterium]
MIKVSIISFSYKRGLPKDFGEDGGGFVFDCRSIPNPYWDERLRKYTGRDEPVRAFMDAHKGEVAAFLCPVEERLRNVLAAAEESGRDRLHVAFGCTGGQSTARSTARRLWRPVCAVCRTLRSLSITRQESIGRHED